MKTKLINLLLISLLVLMFTSCKNNADIERAVETFFIFVIQIICFTLIGLPSLILSVVGTTSKTNTPKVLGWVFLAIFTLTTVLSFTAINEINPKRNHIYIAFVVDALIIGLSLFYLTKSKKDVQSSAQLTDDALDKIIDAEAAPLQVEKKIKSNDDEMEVI